MHVTPVGDTALTVTLSPGQAAAAADALAGLVPPGVTDVLAAFDAVTVVYEPATFVAADPIARLTDWVRATLAAGMTTTTEDDEGRVVKLPVAYGGDGGPDLSDLAASLGLSPGELVRRHAAATYAVAAVGFLPGFAYLAGLPGELHAPRRATPRVRVPAGSVAIGGPYTGVYPVASPGGWHLIGRTTTRLFDPDDPAATSLRVGDRVRFVKGE